MLRNSKGQRLTADEGLSWLGLVSGRRDLGGGLMSSV